MIPLSPAQLDIIAAERAAALVRDARTKAQRREALASRAARADSTTGRRNPLAAVRSRVDGLHRPGAAGEHAVPAAR